MLRRLALLVATVALAALSSPALAQDDGLRIERINQDDYPDIELTVTVPAELGDVRLPKEAFSVTEDGEPRRLYLGALPGETDTTPPSVVLAIDISGSMRDDAINQALIAADAFVEALPAGSEVAVVTFGDRPDVLVPFTDDLAQVRARLTSITVDPTADTALNDGAIQAAELLDGARSDLASIVLLSDGGDSDLGQSLDAAVERLRQSEAAVYAVELRTGDTDRKALDALVGDSGEVVAVDRATELEDAYRNLATTVSRRYLLEYQSTAEGQTSIAINLDYLTSRRQTAKKVDIDGSIASDRGTRPAVASPKPFTVTLPLLATGSAYVAGLSALTISSFMIWLFILLPRRPRASDRLLPESTGGTGPRLSAFAERTTALVERSLQRSPLGRRLDRVLEQAGLDLRPGELVVMVGSLMVIACGIGALIGGPVLAVLLPALVPVGAYLILARRRDRRQAAFSEQLTDLLQLINGSLRAGYGLLQGIDAVARDADEPAASEFRRVLVEQRLGRDLNEAMQNCADRMRSEDFGWVVEAIGIHRDVGGDLARVLDNIIATIRDRAEIHREVRTLSAEGRMSAIVLTGLPFVMLLILQLLSPEYLSPLFVNPIGWLLLGLAATLILIGTVWIRRMVKIRY